MPALAVCSLRRSYRADRGRVLEDVSLEIGEGNTLALLGRSGCGKSTLARCLVGMEPIDAGTIAVDGLAFSPTQRSQRRRVQMVWQDAVSSLSPYRTAGQSLREPLDAFEIAESKTRDTRVEELSAIVGLRPELLNRRPHQLSGGECQRVVIARALAPDPRILILDEPLSALDPPSQAEMLPVIRAVAAQAARAVLLISHDLTAVRQLATRVALLHEGKIIEEQLTEDFFAAPKHPQTREFLAAWTGLPF